MKSKPHWRVLSFAICFLLLSSFKSFGFYKDILNDLHPGAEGRLEDRNAEKVKGRVTDGDGNAVANVSVGVQGTTVGTMTDQNGEFTIQVEVGQVIVFSSIGFEMHQVKYTGQKVLDVKLESSLHKLDEVVAIGYGTTTKKEVTGSVSTVKAEDFIKGAVNNPMGLIQGKVPGLSITRTQGNNPNGGYQILLRGLNTLSGGKQPLIIVDGIVGTNTLDMIDPNDIVSIDVLKDGSAASIYGTRATNGVILITTKKPEVGKVKYEFSSYLSSEMLAEKKRFFTPDEYRKAINDYYPELKEVLDDGQSTDWLKEITRTPLTQYYSFSATGGTSALSFRADLYYKNNQGIVQKTDAQTVTPSLFISSTGLNGKLKIDARLIYSMIKRRGDNNNAIFQAVVRNPTQPVYDPSDVTHGGYYTDVTSSGQLNPVAMINERQNSTESQLFTGDVMAAYKIIDDLKFNVHYSFNSQQDNSGTFLSQYYPELGRKGEAFVSNDFVKDILFEPGFEYKKDFNGHKLQAMAGYSYFQSESKGLDISNFDFPVEDFSYNNIGAGSALGLGLASVGNSRVSNRLISFYSRVMYNFQEKYLLSVSARYEGSSKFGANNKWGLFPSISAGWRITEEDFAKNSTWLSNLKIRAGYGVTGNQDIPNYQSLSRVGTTNRLFYYNGQWINSYAPSSNPNPNLKWEKKGEFDAGVDFGLLNDRISGTFDFYSRKISDLLWNYTVPVPPNVYPTTYANVGIMDNKGIELSLTGQAVKTKNFNWETTVLYTQNRNKLVSFSDAPRGYKLDFLQINPVNGTWSQLVLEGQPVGNFVAPVYLGLDDNGEAVYKDVNNDGKVDIFSHADREVVGNAYPKFELGWNNQLNYKKFDLSFFFRGVFGHSLVNYERAMFELWRPFVNSRNIYKSTLDNPGYKGNTTYDSRYVEKASFVKFENISLGYTTKIAKTNQIRMYASCQNLFTITNYKGVDPEVPISNFDLRPAVNGVENLNYYPYTVTFLFGVNLNF